MVGITAIVGNKMETVKFYDFGIIILLGIVAFGAIMIDRGEFRDSTPTIDYNKLKEQAKKGDIQLAENKSGCDTKYTVRYKDKHTGGWIETCQGRLLQDGESTKVLTRDRL